MKNRKLILILSLVLALTMSLGGTLAYLTDTDSDVNTMELGNVKIEQHEYERAIDAYGNYVTYTETERDGNPTGYKLQAYTQDKPLLPAVGAVSGTPENDWDDTRVYFAQLPDDSAKGTMPVLAGIENIQDKFVFVENTGKTDAYVRTLIAYEAGTMDKAKWEDLVVTSANTFWKETELEGIVAINGNNYVVVEYLYDGNQYPEGGAMVEKGNGKHDDGIVHPGEFTYCNLAQIYLMPQATNEDLIALDGNANGTYDIIVLSQAVQANGFGNAQTALEAGFGAATADSTEVEGKTNVQVWLEAASTQLPKVHNVTDAAGLVAAAKEGGVIDLTGKTITFDGNRGEYITAPAEGSVKIIGGTIAGYKGDGELQMAANIKQGNVIFENVTFKIDEETSGWAMNVNISGTANVTFRNCTFTGVGCPIYQSGANTVVTIEDCTFEGESIQAEIYNGDYQLGQDLIVKNCDFGTIAKVLEIYDYDKNPSSEDIAQYLKDNGNTFTGLCKQTCN